MERQFLVFSENLLPSMPVHRVYIYKYLMSRCLSAPDATALYHCLQVLDTKRPVKRGFVTPFYTTIALLFQALPASWGIISHMLVLATPPQLCMLYLDPYHTSLSCLFLRQ